MTGFPLFPSVDDLFDAPTPVSGEDEIGPGCPDDDAGHTERLDWHLNRAGWYQQKIAATETERDRMIDRYRTWAERATREWRRKAAESEAYIVYAHLDAIAADPKYPKTLHLPSGTVRSVAARPSVVVDDPEAFRVWVTGRDDSQLLARWRCEPVKEAVRQALLDGEAIPGVRLDEGERRVTVTFDNEPEETATKETG